MPPIPPHPMTRGARIVMAVYVTVMLTGALLVGFIFRGTEATVVPVYPAKLIGCGAYLAEDEAAHIRLVDFSRNDGIVNPTYRCVGGDW